MGKLMLFQIYVTLLSISLVLGARSLLRREWEQLPVWVTLLLYLLIGIGTKLHWSQTSDMIGWPRVP